MKTEHTIKITLTTKELTEIVRSKYGFSMDVDVNLIIDDHPENKWSNVAVDTLIVAYHAGQKLHRHFSHYSDGYVYCFTNGATSKQEENLISFRAGECIVPFRDIIHSST